MYAAQVVTCDVCRQTYMISTCTVGQEVVHSRELVAFIEQLVCLERIVAGLPRCVMCVYISLPKTGHW